MITNSVASDSLLASAIYYSWLSALNPNKGITSLIIDAPGNISSHIGKNCPDERLNMWLTHAFDNLMFCQI